MTHTDRFSIKRTCYVIFIAVVFILANTLMCSLASVLMDKFLCILAVNICYLCLFILLIIYKRLRNSLPEYNYISYGKIAFVIIIEWCIIIVCNVVFPNFFAPIIVLPIIASTVFDDSLEYIFSLYLVIVSSLCWDFSTNIVLCYVTMILFGGLLAYFVKESEYLNKLYTFVILLSITTLISIVFYYFNYLELTLIIFIYALSSGVVACIITAIIFPLLNRFVVDAQETVYEAFLDPDFSLFNEVRKFSYIEFKHATRISNLSKKCAKAINANYRLAECAAFYYRLGKIEGEPMIDNAIKLANNYCFPNDVIQILSEYGGIVSLPSTKESAIVHMVDSVVTRVELFDSDSMSSSWNQNMVIYQTINELSQKGFYDNSGLTMNQFLVIREILANEDILA